MAKKVDHKTESKNESKTYQTMLEDVENIVRTVGTGHLDLDEVVTKIEEGYKLIKTMRTRLDATKTKVEELRSEFERGDPTEGTGQQTSVSPANTPTDDDDDVPF